MGLSGWTGGPVLGCQTKSGQLIPTVDAAVEAKRSTKKLPYSELNPIPISLIKNPSSSSLTRTRHLPSLSKVAAPPLPNSGRREPTPDANEKTSLIPSQAPNPQANDASTLDTTRLLGMGKGVLVGADIVREGPADMACTNKLGLPCQVDFKTCYWDDA
ncbi:Non-specific lipid-transfer protein [Corchorus olitorius]|uniref:Non-specific lipid-transfer protein n=1 Tax=Corchorus olitorius TaxID=93759 RepID=A0A1R3G426_9ROSI|nr:Non-specific lipid-transfer protein [Corchorus olitorius]